MKKQIALLAHLTQKVNRQPIQLVLTRVALVLLVLGVGAPTDGTGPGPH